MGKGPRLKGDGDYTFRHWKGDAVMCLGLCQVGIEQINDDNYDEDDIEPENI